MNAILVLGYWDTIAQAKKKILGVVPDSQRPRQKSRNDYIFMP